MKKQLVLLIAGVVLIGAAACSKTEEAATTSTTVASASSGASSTTKAGDSGNNPDDKDKTVDTLEITDCITAASANLALLTSQSAADAQKAVDDLKKLDAPDEVVAAGEHFVQTGGSQIDDPDMTENSKIVADWVDAACPG